MRLKIFLLMMILLLVVSCQKTAEKGVEINYKQGFMDIDLNSLGNSEEYQEQALELPISIHNTLAYDLEDVIVSVKGFDTHYVELYQEQQEINALEGRSIFNHDGMEERLLFQGMIKKLLPGADKEEQNYRVYVKYNSKVEFSPSVCVASQQPGGSVGSAYDTYQGGCSFQKEISYKGQGAPVGVTRLEVVPRQGRQIELRMAVENKGAGTAGRISVGTVTLGGKALTCEFRGNSADNSFFFEEENSATLVCAGYLSSDATYTTPLYVELRYDYEINQKEKLVILE